ncbi:DUF5107 domain-containing protein [Dinghuibacter silviterrae]|uniref:Tetratricopeptide repeat protein n=1 Tax=Dinghuibacter silviterrae TaxID=1539049 RepID=A0A4R8DGR6_9BACT|nr:DUF5107 domain-containing protein [Dinghuibacter silviterrae]TDW96871.1 tetratricopeptide repeat protein [Dinghuibacter silviterrae]
MDVKAWIEEVRIPTYKAGQPEKNPLFLEKRVYQGSSGVVYPHPVIEHISDHKEDVTYTAVFLENEYLKIMLLPELGGRVQRAYDKVRGRDFVYYNQVIKPALVGLAGPWISGGIEFNWPQHHRPSTFSPVDFSLEEHPDGSRTVWMNEVEIMFRTKGLAGFTLYPDKAYLEIRGKLFNRTPFPQTFLWWANPAVKVGEHYQSLFPPDVYAVFDHGKRDVSDFPIATGTYYKVNYAPGTDISRYVNIPVPTSYMAIRSRYDFMGCYEHDTQAGMLHVADHHVSPGKKQWTWGNGDFGKAWDRNLTDEDGPYIELMTGVFTDNQPDFSWLQPNEEKTFEQYFMPFAGVGMVKNATKEAMVNLEEDNVSVYATSRYPGARIQIFRDDTLIKEYTFDLSPAHIFSERLPGAAGCHVAVLSAEGVTLVAYRPDPPEVKAQPSPATAAKSPAEIEQVEELYLNGLHLEQYRHATYNPVDYYEEGLKRSPGDIRCNNALGLWLLRRGQFKSAEPYFRRAIATLTLRNPNPYEGEPLYNLGWSLMLQGRIEDAYDAFAKAAWNDAWQHSAFLSMARIKCQQKQWRQALEHVNKSLVRNAHSVQARHLKAVVLRQLGRDNRAFIQESLDIDPFNMGCAWEGRHPDFAGRMRGALNNYLELSLDYAYMGLYEEAGSLLDDSTLGNYYKAWFALKAGQDAGALYRKAAQGDPSLVFPNKIEEILILESALEQNPTDAHAACYLGNLWYDKRQYAEAIDCWEKAIQIDPAYALPFRNLALAYYNKTKETAKAIHCLEQAFLLDQKDARVLMELDQLYKVTGRPVQERLDLLERYLPLVGQRDDLYLERVSLYNLRQDHEKAKALLAGRIFHPWEGGEGKVVRQYLYSQLGLAKQAIDKGAYDRAEALLEATVHYPENLGEGKLYGTPENDRLYLMGCIYEARGRVEEARAAFEEATLGADEPVQAIFYNDPQPDKIYYQALAWQKLGETAKAWNIFERFIRFGEAHIEDKIHIDYFAVSLPDMLVFDQDLDVRNRQHCHYLMGLGYLGLGQTAAAEEHLSEVLRLDPAHAGATQYLHTIQKTLC